MMRTHASFLSPSAIAFFVALLALTQRSLLDGAETGSRLELRLSATPKTVLVREGKHDFSVPLRIPVESEGPTIAVTLKQGDQTITRYSTKVETVKLDNENKSIFLLVFLDEPIKEPLDYEVQHTIANPIAPLFSESYRVEGNDKEDPSLYRDFLVQNRTGVSWGELNQSLRLVLIHEKRGVLFDDQTKSIAHTSTFRIQQKLDCRVESDAIWIDPISTVVGDAKQSLRLFNGAYGDGKRTRAELPKETNVEIRRAVPNPTRPLQVAAFPRDVPIGVPESVHVPCNCGVDSTSSLSRLTLDIGTRTDVHVTNVSNSPKSMWLPMGVTPTGIVYFTGVSRSIRVHNRSAATISVGISNVITGDTVSFSKVVTSLSLGSGQSLDMADATGFDLKLIDTAPAQVSKTDDVPLYLETAKKLSDNLKSYLQADTTVTESLRQFYCTHPSTRQKVRCMELETFREYLQSMVQDIDKSRESLVKFQKELDELKKARDSKSALTATLQEYSSRNGERYAKERIRLASRLEDVNNAIQKIQTRLVPIQAEQVWNANPKRFGFEGQPWERQPEAESLGASYWSSELKILKTSEGIAVPKVEDIAVPKVIEEIPPKKNPNPPDDDVVSPDIK